MDYECLFAHLQAIWYEENQSIWRICLQMEFSDLI